jgi:hypothetical protein
MASNKSNDSFFIILTVLVWAILIIGGIFAFLFLGG